MRIEANLHKLKPWLDKNKFFRFQICFAYPPSKSKEKIMIRIDNKIFYTLSEIEKDVGTEVFIITE